MDDLRYSKSDGEAPKVKGQHRNIEMKKFGRISKRTVLQKHLRRNRDPTNIHKNNIQ